MDAAKIRLSPEELAMVVNADLILTKNRILEKAMLLLGDLQVRQQAFLNVAGTALPAAIRNSEPKIARGENYLGLPWLMLDYPRVFRHQDQFAIRSFFWWGNFLSCTLQLSGEYKNEFAPHVNRSFDYLKDNAYLVCTGDDLWQHHFGEDNYSAVESISALQWENNLDGKNFIKLTKGVSLHEWDHATENLLNIFEDFIRIVAGQLPNR